jgi:CHASE3 domain sensor protein
VHKPLSFARKIAFGYLAAGGLALLIGVIAIHSLRNIAADKDRLITVYGENLVNAATLESLCERTIAANRGYLLTGDASHLETAGKSDDEYEHVFDQLSQCTRTTADAAALDRIAVLRSSYELSIEKVLQGRIAGRTMDELSALMIADAVPRARALRTAITDFIEVEKSQMDAAQVASARTIGTIRIALVVLTIIAGGATVALGILFSRTLAQQLAMAIDAVRNSWNEIETAAYRQNHDARKQLETLNELELTIQDVIATAGEIAESAQQLAVVHRSDSDLAGKRFLSSSEVAIKRQIDVIRSKTVYLGHKSERMGGMLQDAKALADQSSQVALNASLRASELKPRQYPYLVHLGIRCLTSLLALRRTAEE